MCGRYSATFNLGKLILDFGIEENHFEDWVPRFNVAPTQVIAIVLGKGGKRLLVPMRWGLIPSWAKDPSIGNRMINARSETIEEKPSFRTAFRSRRCLVPADSFYEWKRDPNDEKQKAPMRLYAHGKAFAFAGLWDRWKAPGGETIYSATILTTSPNATVRDIHDRMPVILDPKDYSTWIDPASPIETVRALLRPAPDHLLESYEVSKNVNSPKNESADLIEPLSRVSS